MGFLEELGEKAIDYSRRAFHYALDTIITLLKSQQKATERLDRFSLYPIMEKRGVEFKDYLVLKTQVLTLAFLFTVVLYIFGRLSGRPFIILAVIVGISSVSSVTALKDHFSEFSAYRDFFFSYLGISFLLLAVKLVKPTLNTAFPYIHFVAIALLYIVLFSVFFRTKYARDYTYGKVVEGDGTVKVKVNYDILSSVKPGIHIFKNDIQAKVGDVVKLAVSKGFLNLSGSKITLLLEVSRINPEKENIIS